MGRAGELRKDGMSWIGRAAICTPPRATVERDRSCLIGIFEEDAIGGAGARDSLGCRTGGVWGTLYKTSRSLRPFLLNSL